MAKAISFAQYLIRQLKLTAKDILGTQSDTHKYYYQQNHFNIIIRSGEHLLSLINNVLDIANIRTTFTSGK